MRRDYSREDRLSLISPKRISVCTAHYECWITAHSNAIYSCSDFI